MAGLEKKGTLVANGKKIAVDTWFSSVYNDEDPEQTLQDLVVLLLSAFKACTCVRTSTGMTLRLTCLDDTTVDVALPVATASLAGIIKSTDYTKLSNIPSPDTIALKSSVITRFGTFGSNAEKVVLNGINSQSQIIATLNMPAATQSAAGVMAANDKTMLDRLVGALGTASPIAEYLRPRVIGETKTLQQNVSESFSLPAMYSGESVVVIADRECRIETGSPQISPKTLIFNEGGEQQVAYSAASAQSSQYIAAQLIGVQEANVTVVILPTPATA